jgi:hypothetical protein
MTKIFPTTLITILLLSNTLSAQKIRATETTEKIGGGKNPSLAVMIYETDESTVLKEWKSLMKKNDGKVSESHGEMVAKNVLLNPARAGLHSDTLTVYARTEKADEGIKLIVSMEPSSETAGMKRIMEDFARKLTKESIATQQKDAEKELDKEERNLARLVRDNSDLHNDITRYNDKIKKAEDDIKENLRDQEDKKRVVEVKRKLLDAVKDKAIHVD